jgi:hypothetical protein
MNVHKKVESLLGPPISDPISEVYHPTGSMETLLSHKGYLVSKVSFRDEGDIVEWKKGESVIRVYHNPDEDLAFILYPKGHDDYLDLESLKLVLGYE